MDKFKDKKTQRLFETGKHRSLDNRLGQRARQALIVVATAPSLDVIGSAPGRDLKPFKEGGKGCYRIKVNRQYRIVFYWVDGEAIGIEFIDYH